MLKNYNSFPYCIQYFYRVVKISQIYSAAGTRRGRWWSSATIPPPARRTPRTRPWNRRRSSWRPRGGRWPPLPEAGSPRPSPRLPSTATEEVGYRPAGRRRRCSSSRPSTPAAAGCRFPDEACSKSPPPDRGLPRRPGVCPPRPPEPPSGTRKGELCRSSPPLSNPCHRCWRRSSTIPRCSIPTRRSCRGWRNWSTSTGRERRRRIRHWSTIMRRPSNPSRKRRGGILCRGFRCWTGKWGSDAAVVLWTIFGKLATACPKQSRAFCIWKLFTCS